MNPQIVPSSGFPLPILFLIRCSLLDIPYFICSLFPPPVVPFSFLPSQCSLLPSVRRRAGFSNGYKARTGKVVIPVFYKDYAPPEQDRDTTLLITDN